MLGVAKSPFAVWCLHLNHTVLSFAFVGQAGTSVYGEAKSMNPWKLIAPALVVACLSGCGKHSERLVQLPNGQYRIDTVRNGVVTKTRLNNHDATTNALYSGDSATRLTVLTQIQQELDTQPTMAFDQQTSAWILPAIEQCKKDVDPEVVSLAEELAIRIKEKTQPPPP
jgi:hypothetical protein